MSDQSESSGKKRKIHKKHRYMRGGMMSHHITDEEEAEYRKLEQEAKHPPEDQREEMLRRKQDIERNRKINIEEWVSSVCGNIPEGWNDNFNLLLNHLTECLNSPDMQWSEPYSDLIRDLKRKTQDLIKRNPRAKDGLNKKMNKLESLIKTKKLAAKRAEEEALALEPAPAPLSLGPSDMGSLENIADFHGSFATPIPIISSTSHQLLRDNPKWQGGSNCGPSPDYLCPGALDFHGNQLSSRSCMICGNDYTLTKRKHHCRRCGISVCGDCSSKKLTLKTYLNDKKPHEYREYAEKNVRVCNLCYDMENNPPFSDFSPLSFDKTDSPVGETNIDDLLARLEKVTGGGKRKFKRKKTQKRKKNSKKSNRRKTHKRKSKKKRRNKTKRR